MNKHKEKSNMNEIYEKLNDIFKDVFDDEDIIVSEDTIAEDVVGWDSLEHITLVTVIQEEFGIEFDLKTINSFKNVGDMAREIARLVGDKV